MNARLKMTVAALSALLSAEALVAASPALAADAAKPATAATAKQDAVAVASQKAKDFAINTQKQAASGDAYIPIDTSLALSEGFKATKEKQAAIDKANQHLAKGEHKNAIEVLKLANIDLTESAALIPAKAVLSHISDAATLVGEKKYYEANLALKAAEDAVIVEAYSVDAIPVQGQKVKAS